MNSMHRLPSEGIIRIYFKDNAYGYSKKCRICRDGIFNTWMNPNSENLYDEIFQSELRNAIGWEEIND